MTALPGWMAAILVDDKDVSPETGGFTLGGSANLESYNAVGFNSARRALINSETSITLDSFRYGDSAEGLLELSDNAGSVDCVILLGGFNNAENPWVSSDHPYGFVPVSAKIGKVAASGISFTAPYDGLVAATADIPQADQWAETKPSTTGKYATSPVVYVDIDDTTNVATVSAVGQNLYFLCLECKPANNGTIKVKPVKGGAADVTVTPISVDDNACQIIDLGPAVTANDTVTFTFSSSSNNPILTGYLFAVSDTGQTTG